MSNVFSDAMYGSFSSWKANDGNNDTQAKKVGNSCIHTHEETDPWWAVDLGAVLYVIGVLFTNRAENFGNISVNCVYRPTISVDCTAKGCNVSSWDWIS